MRAEIAANPKHREHIFASYLDASQTETKAPKPMRELLRPVKTSSSHAQVVKEQKNESVVNEKYWGRAWRIHNHDEKRRGNALMHAPFKHIAGGVIGSALASSAAVTAKGMMSGSKTDLAVGAGALATSAGSAYYILKDHIKHVRRIRRELLDSDARLKAMKSTHK
jgi:hypothetical protein